MSNDSSKIDNGSAARLTSPYVWSPAAAVALIVVSFAILPRIAEILLAALPQLVLGWNVDQIDAWFDLPIASFLYVLLAEAMTIGMLVWFIRRRKQPFVKAAGLSRLPRLRDAAYTIGGILVYFGLFIVTILVLTQLLPINIKQEQAVGFSEGISGTDLWLAFASLVILPPVAEEIIFRGFLFGTLRARRVAFAWAAFGTSLLFAALHLFGSADGDLLWIAFVDTFVLSLVLCYVREKTDVIWACIAIHALKNLFVFLHRFVFNIA